jgi:hypothetical protein
MRIIETIQ